MESIFPKRVFSSQSNLPDWCCFMFDKSKPFKFNARIKTEACNCMNNFSLHQTLFEQAFEKKEKKQQKSGWVTVYIDDLNIDDWSSILRSSILSVSTIYIDDPI